MKGLDHGFAREAKRRQETFEGVAPIPPEELKRKLLALGNDQVPFSIAPGGGGKEGDLIVERKIVDAKWLEIFAKASLEKSHKIYLTLNAGLIPGA